MEQRPASALRSAIPPPPPPLPSRSRRQRIFTSSDQPKPSFVRAPPPPPPAPPKPSAVRAPPPSAPPKPSVRRWAGPPPSTMAPPPPPVQPEDPPTAARASPPPPPTLSGLHADVFAAHKLVLAARSPVFRANFFGAAKEKPARCIRICDMHPDAFAAMLHHVYTDSLPEMVTATTTSAQGEEEAAVLAQDLLVAADRYKLKDLKSVTEEQLCNHVSVTTVLPMLALAEHHQCWKLKKTCLEFMASSGNTRAIVANNDDLEHLARNCPSVVKDVLTKILDSREATPSKPLVASIDNSSYVDALIVIFCMICAIAFWGMVIRAFLLK